MLAGILLLLDRTDLVILALILLSQVNRAARLTDRVRILDVLGPLRLLHRIKDLSVIVPQDLRHSGRARQVGMLGLVDLHIFTLNDFLEDLRIDLLIRFLIVDV